MTCCASWTCKAEALGVAECATPRAAQRGDACFIAHGARARMGAQDGLLAGADAREFP